MLHADNDQKTILVIQLFTLAFSFFDSFQAVNGGLVMVAFYPHFLSCAEKATIKDVVGKYMDGRSVFLRPKNLW